MHDHSQVEQKLDKKVVELLAEYLGTDANEIKPDDGLESTLHMTPSDIYEFSNLLKDNGLNITDEAVQDVVSVSDLIDAVSSETIIT